MTPTNAKRYVSKSIHYTFHVRPAIVDYITDDYNRVREREVDPPLVCEFDNLVLRSRDQNALYDRAFATRAFFPRSAWRDSTQAQSGHQILGAIPSMTPQAMRATGPAGEQILKMTEPYDPTLHFGVFYLDWIPDLKRRAEAERALDSHGFNGVEFVEVIAEALPKPWPTYDKIAPQGRDKKIVAMVRELGLSPMGVFEYEQANQNQQVVLAALLELAEAQQSEAEDEASLERVL